ncbi:MAG TPA: FHA domain-containing protein [Pirellulaceae bacterium]|nr:FHA domain-containing protein [Pirellulaceae bacterium]
MTGSPTCEMPTAETTIRSELTLRVIGSEHDGRLLRIQAPKCTIGSGSDCTLRLRAPGVQRMHCLILRGPGGLAVRNWSHDTRLNGRAFQDAELNPGDRLTIGPVELEIVDEHQAVATTTETSKAAADEQRRLQRLERLVREETQKRDELAQILNEKEAALVQLQTRLTESEAQVEQLRGELHTAAASGAPTDPAALAELESLKQQAEALAHQFAMARKSFAAERDTWQAERAHLNGDIEKLRQLHAQHVEMEREARDAKVAVTHWREQYEEQKRLLEDRDSLALIASDDDNSQADEQLQLRAELELAARELDAETERLLEAEADLDKQRQAWNAEVAELQAELTAQRETLAAQAAELASERAAWESLRSEVTPTSEPIAQDDAELARREKELAAREQELMFAQAELENERETLERDRLAMAGGEATTENPAAELIAAREQLNFDREELERLRDELAQQRQLWDDERAAAAWQAEQRPYEATAIEERPTVSAEEVAEYVEPESPADVIARLSASGLWKDEPVDAYPTDELPHTEPQLPEPAWKNLVPETPKPAPPVTPAEDDDSIESYMQRLLMRVSGDNESTRAMSKPTSPELKAAEAPVQMESIPSRSHEEHPHKTLDFNNFVPRSSAPEQAKNLAAMRDLANSTARGAIDASSKRRSRLHAHGKYVMALITTATAIGAYWLSMQYHNNLAFYGAIASVIVSSFWWTQAALMWRKVLISERLADDSDDGADTSDESDGATA